MLATFLSKIVLSLYSRQVEVSFLLLTSYWIFVQNTCELRGEDLLSVYSTCLSAVISPFAGTSLRWLSVDSTSFIPVHIGDLETYFDGERNHIF